MSANVVAIRPQDSLPSLPALSSRLERLVAAQGVTSRFSADDHFVGTKEIWRPQPVDPADVPELSRTLASVEEALAPAERGRLLARVLALLAQYRDRDPLPPAVEQAVAEDWADDLGDFPEWAVVEACRRWRRDPVRYRFKPLPGDIRALCADVVAKETTLAYRLRTLLSSASIDRGLPPPRRADDVKARVAALAAAKRVT